LERFLAAADQELSGHQLVVREGGPEDHFSGRDRTLFALAGDLYAGGLSAYCVPALPPNHPERGEQATPRRRYLPAPAAE
jgi:hypothetical protein